MKKIQLFVLTTVCACTFLITNSCSQTVPGKTKVFSATTPYTAKAKSLLHITSGEKYEMMRWHLAMSDGDPSTGALPFTLDCTYGMGKAGTRGFGGSPEKIELTGKYTMTKKNGTNIYRLTAENSPIKLSFIEASANILHLLDGEDHMMIGTGAWSYTFNRANPITANKTFYLGAKSSFQSRKDSAVIGVFDGRTPCNKELTDLNGISLPGCQIIKCRLILYQDIRTQAPEHFELMAIYVGKGDNRYTTSGKWQVRKGIAADPSATVYVLFPDGGKASTFSFLKGDDNILFFLDTDDKLLVGDEYTSYTLNRSR